MDDPDVPANECTEPELIELADPDNPQFTLKKIACTTPAWSIASGDEEEVRVIAVVGADRVYSPPSVTYRYYSFGGNFTPDNPCDDVTLAGASFSGGDGLTDATPYVVCNRSQLENVTINEGYYFLGDNIDLRDSEWTPINPELRLRFEGAPFDQIMNLLGELQTTYGMRASNASFDSVGTGIVNSTLVLTRDTG